jgi:hypothetical protein
VSNLCEAENVVNEEEHVLTLLVPKVLGHGEAGQSNTGTRARGLVHLTVHQRHLGALVLERDDTTLNHLVIQVISYGISSPLKNTPFNF